VELLGAELLVRIGEFVAILGLEVELSNEVISMSDAVLVLGTIGRLEVKLVKKVNSVVLLESGVAMVDVELELVSEEESEALESNTEDAVYSASLVVWMLLGKVLIEIELVLYRELSVPVVEVSEKVSGVVETVSVEN
jgi:hypothetical protein